MNPEFISEPLTSVSSDPAKLATGEPGVPIEFDWRGQHYRVVKVVKQWKGVSDDRTHGSSEQYVHKHWFRVRTDDDKVMTIYFERQSRSRRQATQRWWLYSLK